MLLLAAAALLGPATPTRAQTPPARLVADGSEIVGGWFGRGLDLRLQIDRPVPFRVFTLDDPMRLVVDFEGLDPTAFDAVHLRLPGTARALHVGRMRPGWARLILDLARPMALDTAELVRRATGVALEVHLKRVGATDFAETAGAPPGVWPSGASQGGSMARARGDGPMTIMLDPGHGGIDPGALRDGVAEKDVVLAFAGDLRAALLATGRFRVVLTRETDDFVSLSDRVAAARAAGADVFISLHTNAAADTHIAGAIAFTLSEEGSSRAANDRAAMENQADAVAGMEAVRSADPVLRVLSEIARTETDARSASLARALAGALAPLTGATSQDPLQSANFEVLRGSAMPSVLLEIGFLSNDADRANMLSAGWRARASDAIAAAMERWSRDTGGLTRK